MTPALENSKRIYFRSTVMADFFSEVKWEHLVAGTLGGVAATSILHPLDLVKVRLQVSEEGRGRDQGQALRRVVSSLLKQDGLRGLYRGVAPNVVGAGVSWGFYFFVYNHLKLRRLNNTRTFLDPLSHMLIASQAGVATLLLTNPIWVVKTRLCLQNSTLHPPTTTPHPSTTTTTQHLKTHSSTHPTHSTTIPQTKLSPPCTMPRTTPSSLSPPPSLSSPPPSSTIPQYNGMVDCMVKLFRNEGLPGLYKGLVPGLFGVSHGAVQFMSYEQMKISYNHYHHRPSNQKLTTLEYLAFAASSKIIASSITYPYQVVRSRLQSQHSHYTSSLEVIRHTYRKEGLKGFFKGLLPGVVRVTPACCITFLVYEKVLQALGG